MKKLYTLLSILFISVSTFAQAPQNMSYQAVIRDANGLLVESKVVGVQISILQGSINGTPVYVETHTPTTNANGLMSFEVGNGTVVSGDMSTIDWANGPYFIQSETDPNGGSNYTISGTSPLLAVPYALHANVADSLAGGVTEADPVFSNSVAGAISTADTTRWNQNIDSLGLVNLGFHAGPHTVNTDSQSLSLSGTTLSISNGNNVNLSTIDTDTQLDSAGVAALGFVAGPHTINTDDQTLSLSGTTLTIAGGNNVDLSSIDTDTDTQLDSAGVAALGFVAGPHTVDTDTDDQTLSLSGTTLSIADGNNVDLSSINTDTQLDSAGVAALGFVAGPHTIDTDDQTLSLSGTTLTIAGGNNVDLSSIDTDTDTQLDSAGVAALGFVAGPHTVDTDTDDQTLSLSGTTLSIADGNNVDLSSINTDTDDQTLSLSGTTLTISDGNNVDLSSIDTDTDTQLDSAGVAALGYVAGPLVTGSDKQISFNDNGKVGNDAELVYNKTTNQMAIGASTVNTSAALEVNSTTGGFMLPRMTTAQRDAISSPQVGLMIFNTDSGSFQGYTGFNSGGDITITHNTFLGTLTFAGQSFTAISNGHFTEVVFDFHAAVTGGTLQIFSGHNATGTPIHTQSFNVGTGQQSIVLTQPILLTAGQQYTIITDASCGYYPFATYAGGSAWTVTLSFPGDLWMKVITKNAEWKNLHD